MTPPTDNQAGMTYLLVMVLVIILSVSLMKVSQQWSVTLKRDREAELLFRGNRIKDAIDRYVADYEIQKATRPNRWPRTLKELTQKNPKRYLQVAYSDPITGEAFDLIKVGEELHGVHSSSTDEPFDKVHFKNAQSYRAIRFESTGVSNPCASAINPLLPCPTGNQNPSAPNQPKDASLGKKSTADVPPNQTPTGEAPPDEFPSDDIYGELPPDEFPPEENFEDDFPSEEDSELEVPPGEEFSGSLAPDDVPPGEIPFEDGPPGAP